MIPIIVLVVIVAGAYGTAQYWRSLTRRQRMAERLLAPDTGPAPDEAAQGLLRLTYADMLLGGALGDEDLPGFLRRPGIQARRAGLRLGHVDMLLLLLVTGLLAGGVVYYRYYRWRQGWTWAFTGKVCGAGLLGALIPYWIVKFMASSRIQKLESQLADTLDQIIGALQSGIGFRQALEVTRANCRPPMKDVLIDVLVRSNLGVPFMDAFRDEARSLNSKYFDMLAVAISANSQAGAALTPMLTGLVRRIRESIRFRRRVRSLTSEARFSSVILFIAPLALAWFINFRSPDSLPNMYKDYYGKIFTWVTICLYFIAMYWTIYLLRFDD